LSEKQRNSVVVQQAGVSAMDKISRHEVASPHAAAAFNLVLNLVCHTEEPKVQIRRLMRQASKKGIVDRLEVLSKVGKIILGQPPNDGLLPFQPETDLGLLPAGPDVEAIREKAKQHPNAWGIDPKTGQARLHTQINESGGPDRLAVILAVVFILFCLGLAWSGQEEAGEGDDEDDVGFYP
jgi:hypothetical protein